MDEQDVKKEEDILSQEATRETVEKPTAQAAKPKEENLDYKDKYIRAMAEFDNMRKRHERDRMDLIKYAHEEVIVECLKIYDDLERSLNAFKTKEGTDANLVKGLEMVYKNLKDLMGKNDVKPIETVGKPFDHNTQEVLMQEETKDFPDGVVMEEFEKGYTLGGRVVRTAKVKVAKNIS